MNRLLAVLAAALLLCACQDPGAPNSDFTALQTGLPPAGANGATFMTRNIYPGGNLDLVIGATDPNQIPFLAAIVYHEVQYTDFHTRAKGIADEIASTHPAVIGLQEVPDIYLDGVIQWDFLQILQDELASRGIHYTAIDNRTSDVTLPLLVLDFSTNPPTPIFDEGGNPQFHLARFVDGDAMLIADGIPFANAAHAEYDSLADLFGVTKVVRGWIGADVTIGGSTFRVMNTHLESQNPSVSVPQARELLSLVASASGPTVLLGDFNSGPGTDLQTYDVLVGGSGFTDTWVEKNKTKVIWTCCQPELLDNPVSALNQRIDLVLVRDRLQSGNSGLIGGLQTAVVGNLPADRVLAPADPSLGFPARLLWPSDHAGYVATLRVPPAAVAVR